MNATSLGGRARARASSRAHNGTTTMHMRRRLATWSTRSAGHLSRSAPGGHRAEGATSGHVSGCRWLITRTRRSTAGRRHGRVERRRTRSLCNPGWRACHERSLPSIERRALSKRRLSESRRLSWAHRELAERSGLRILHAGRRTVHRDRWTRVRCRTESGAARRGNASLLDKVALVQQRGVDARLLVHRAPEARERLLSLALRRANEVAIALFFAAGLESLAGRRRAVRRHAAALATLAVALVAFACAEVDGPVAAFPGFGDGLLEPAEELVQ